MSNYFGEPWPSGICETAERAATPVGDLCLECDEEIVAGDRGDFVGTASGPRPRHRECALRSAIGGIEHLTAGPHEAGECYVKTTLTRRQSALAAWEWVQRHGIPR